MSCSLRPRLAIVAALLSCFCFSLTTRLCALPTGVQDFYVLGFEEHIYNCLDAIDDIEYGGTGAITSDLVASVISFAVSADGQVVIYDHWEDGHEVDPLEPVQASTEIFGDGDLTNGVAPGTTDDLLSAGDVVILRSDGSGGGVNGYVPVNPRSTAAIRYDGNDRIVTAGGPINLTHATWPSDGTWIGGSWEIYPYQVYADSNSYRVPVGIDSYTRVLGGISGDTGHFGDFQYVYLLVQATEDGTTVIVDNGQATNNQVVVTLDQGESWCSLGRVNTTVDSAWQLDIYEGTTITASAPIQAGVVTGSDGTFQSRYFLLFPESLFSTDYVVPYPSGGTADTQVYVFNPNDQDITVTAHHGPGGATYSFPVPQNGAVPYSVITSGSYAPTTGGIRLSSDQVFWGIGSGSFSDTAYDWGFSLIPDTFVTSEVTAAWSPGSLSGANNWSPIWVSPLSDGTRFFVDVDGDGVFDAVDTDLDGVPDPGPYTADALDVFRFADHRDNDNSGMRIEATGPFISVWGPDPSVADAAGNIDWGNTVLPPGAKFISPGLAMTKTAEPLVVAATGGTVSFRLEASVGAIGPVTGIDVSDRLPSSEWSYVAGTAHVTYPDLTAVQLDPAVSGSLLTWDLTHTLSAFETLVVTFDALYTPVAPGGSAFSTVTEDWESGGYAGGGGWSAGWTEFSDDGSAGSGYVQVSGLDGPYGGTSHLRISGGDLGGVIGVVDISGATAPVLRYRWRTRSLEDGDYGNVWISTDDGSSYSTLRNYPNGTDDNTYHLETVDLSPYRQTGLRLAFGGVLSSTADYVYFDEIEIVDATEGVAPEYGDYRNEGRGTGYYRRFPLVSTDRVAITTSFLELKKTADAASVVVSDVITYELALSNLSSSASATNVVLRDLVPAHTSFVSLAATSGTTAYDASSNTATLSLASLAPGASTTMTLAVRVKKVLFDGTEILNKGWAVCDESIRVESNEVRTGVRIPVLELRADGPGTADEGRQVDYVLSLENTGSATANGVEIVTPIPANATFLWNYASTGAEYSAYDSGDDWSYSPSQADGTPDPNVRRIRWASSTLAASATTVTTFAVQLDTPLASGTRIYEFARHDSQETNRGISNIVVTVVSPLTLAKASSVTTGIPGALIDYVFTLENHDATTTETTVVITDTLPDGSWYQPGTATGSGASIRYSTDGRATWLTSDPNDGLATTSPLYPVLVSDLEWTFASLAPSTVTTFGFQVRIDNPLAANTTLENRASFTSAAAASYGPLYTNRVSIPTVDLTLTQGASPTAAFPGETVTFTFFHGNLGSSVAPGTVVTAAVPAGLTVASIEGGVSSSLSGGVITWTLGDLPPGTTGGVLRYEATVDASVPAGTIFSSVAWATDGLDRQRSNRVDVIRASAGVTLGVNNELWGDRGDTLHHPFSLVNTSAATDDFALSAAVNDWSTTVAVLLDADGDGVYDPALDTVITSLDDVRPGERRHLLLRLTIPASAADGSFNVTELTATSANDGSVSSMSSATSRLIVPLAVRLVEFAARRVAGGVRIEWASSAEWSHAGYRLWRIVSDGSFVAVGPFAPAQGSPVSGARYERFDASVGAEESPWYLLEEIDARGRVRFHGPVTPDELPPPSDEDDGPGAEEDPYVETPSWTPGISSGDGWAEISRDASSVIFELRTTRCLFRPRRIAGRIVMEPRIPSYFHGRRDVAGRPALPVKGILIPLEGFEGVGLELLADEGSLVEAGGPLLPAPRRVVDESLPDGVRYEYEIDEERVWTTEPAEGPAVFVGTRRVGATSYAFVRLHPLRFDGEGRLRLSERLRVRLGLRPAAVASVASASQVALPLTGDVLRLDCRNEGWVRLDGATLMARGLPSGLAVGSFDLRHLGARRPLLVEDDGDGVFGGSDSIAFWAEAREDKYGDASPHFLSWSSGGAPAPGSRPASAVTAPVPADHHLRSRVHELDQFYWMLQPGPDDMDRWFFATPVLPGTTSFTWSLEDAVADQGSGVEVEATFLPMTDVAGVSPDHHLRVRFAGEALAEAEWDGLEGRTLSGTARPAVPWDGSCRLDAELLLPAGVVFDRHMLDRVVVRYRADFVARSGRLDFEMPAGSHAIRATGFTTAEVRALDVSDPAAPLLLEGVRIVDRGDGTFQVDFEDEIDTPRRYHLAAADAPGPSVTIEALCLEGAVAAPPSAQLVVVIPEAHEDLVAPLVARRRAEGLSVLVRSPRWFADEFGHGLRGPAPIRDGLAAIAAQGDLRWVLLCGDATSDPRGRSAPLPEIHVPTWLVHTAFAGETASDHRFSLLDGDEFPDVAVGRLPAATRAELANMVGKILLYEGAADGTWRSRVLAIAGSGEPDFSRLSDDCLDLVPGDFSLGRVYANELQSIAAIRAQVAGAIETGAFLVHYVGHGLVNQWDQEDLLPPATIAALGNGERLPVALSATCFDGYHLGPSGELSRVDALLGAPSGGAVACFSSTGMSKTEAKDPLMRAFYDEIFSAASTHRLGDVVLRAKVDYLSNVVDEEAVAKTHSLFGDPSMLLSLPLPTAPRNLGLRLLGGDAVELVWEAPASGSVSGYVVERQDGAQAGMIRITAQSITATSLVDHLRSGVLTSYRVRALSLSGVEGPPSETVSTLVVLPGDGTTAAGGGGGGCSMALGRGGADPGAILLLLLGLSGLVRRGRRADGHRRPSDF